MTEPKRPSVFIATPMYGGMCTGQYALGLLTTVMRLRDEGYDVAFVNMMNESLITRARNELVRVFMERGSDYLMFIDADIAFPSDGVLALLKAEKDIACGIYPKKEVDWDRVRRAALEGKEDLKDYSGAFVLNMLREGDATTDEHGMIEVRHGGTGFMLIKRSVFETLEPLVPTYRPNTVRDAEGNFVMPKVYEYFATSIDDTGALLSEDYHFCALWREHGGKVHANPFIKLEHVGTYIYGGDVVRTFVREEGKQDV